MSHDEATYATTVVAAVINELLRRNRRTQGRTVREMWVSPRIFVAQLREWKTIDGTCTDVPRPVDEVGIEDLIDDFKRNQ